MWWRRCVPRRTRRGREGHRARPVRIPCWPIRDHRPYRGHRIVRRCLRRAQLWRRAAGARADEFRGGSELRQRDAGTSGWSGGEGVEGVDVERAGGRGEEGARDATGRLGVHARACEVLDGGGLVVHGLAWGMNKERGA